MTTYRFLIEDKATKSLGTNVIVSADGAIIPKYGAGSKNILGTGTFHGGVDHNRYSRIVNPLINNVTGGLWEKGNRLYKGSMDMVATLSNGGGWQVVKTVGFAITGQLAIMALYRQIKKEIDEANQANQANFLKIKSGMMVLGRNDLPQKNIFGKISYGKQ